MTTGMTTPAARKPRKKELKNLTKREGIWYFQKRVNGKKEYNGRRTPFTLETRDLAVAKAKRDAILKSHNGVEVDRILGHQNRGAATLGEIFKAYRAAPTVRASSGTREANIADMTRFIRVVKGAEFEVESFGSAELTKAFAKQWQGRKLELAQEACGKDLAAIEAAKRSMNSLLTHVQSLFSAEAMDDYGALYLPPNVAEFATSLPVKARKQDDPVQLSDAFVADLLAAADGLQAVDPGAWAVFQLMTWGGLRNKECLYANRSWLERVPLGYRVSMKATANFLPKGSSRAVILPADVVDGILAQLPATEQDLVPAKHHSDRHSACYRRINLWLKSRGVVVDARKIGYRLRKYFLAKMNEQQGLFMAQAAAGHASARTTQEHYVGRPVMSVPVKIGA